jgi:hypothetical protein
MIINIQMEDIVKTVNYCLDNKLGFSLVRVGDGEAMMLNHENDTKAANQVLLRQFGEPLLEREYVLTIIDYLEKAISEANLLGIPTPKHVSLGGYWEKCRDIFAPYIPLGSQFCSIDVHTELMVGGYLDEFIQKANKVYYISCRDLDEQFKKRYPMKEIRSFKIAPEMKFTSGYVGKRHFPDQFFEIRSWIDSLDCRGALCLVGAGFAGKIYNVWFGKKRGVSIDLGSVFDAWAGFKTRGPGRGMDVKDDTHKL